MSKDKLRSDEITLENNLDKNIQSGSFFLISIFITFFVSEIYKPIHMSLCYISFLFLFLSYMIQVINTYLTSKDAKKCIDKEEEYEEIINEKYKPLLVKAIIESVAKINYNETVDELYKKSKKKTDRLNKMRFYSFLLGCSFSLIFFIINII